MGTVGIIGLGIMGSAYARNLIKGGVTVLGADPLEGGRQRLNEAGGRAYERAGVWLADCDLAILALASPSILAGIFAIFPFAGTVKRALDIGIPVRCSG